MLHKTDIYQVVIHIRDAKLETLCVSAHRPLGNNLPAIAQGLAHVHASAVVVRDAAETATVPRTMLCSILRSAMAQDEQLISRCLPHSGGRSA